MFPEAVRRATMKVENLGFSYTVGHQVLRDISFTLEPGRIMTLLGPNGSGKTTLLNCMARQTSTNTGHVRIDGTDTGSMSTDEIARSIGFVPQTVVPAFAYATLDYVVTGCAPRMGLFRKPGPAEYETAWQALELMELTHLAHKPYTEISGGERQQVTIARALAQQAGILLMDEPTAHLDYGNQVKVLRIIKTLAARGYAVCITTHNPDHALMLGDRVAVLGRNGSFTFGTPESVITGTFLSSLYDIDILVRRIDGLDRDICVAHPF